MSDLKFEDDYRGGNVSYNTSPKGMVGWLINKGIVPNQKTGEIVLLVFAVACFGLTFYILKDNSPSPRTEVVDFESISSEAPFNFNNAN